ncbi:hypothetical protein K9O81_18890 [Leclercia adecarboxylata]|uniref:hypothetical protein n=1 Tax=Leclercia adecarboxylata TaxID=83655 RepID=UPI001CBEAB4D|nr:hypothetical protein [Leclercia adecarboxylata]MBZ3802438.1 hypothetical protein [Leclercia adecarboxylata]MBZ3807074.1 hypothetical protein [Leclercia adecarboxylata]
MTKSAAELIASIKGAGSLDALYSVLGPSDALKNPRMERRLRLNAIPEQYGPHMTEWPAEVKAEYERLCQERDRDEALEAEQFQFEKKKRL